MADKNGHDTPGKSGILLTWAKDRMVPDIGVIAMKDGEPLVTKDEDGDINVVLLSANPSAKLASLQLPKEATGIAAVPYDAASHGATIGYRLVYHIVLIVMLRHLLRGRVGLLFLLISLVSTASCVTLKVMLA